MRAGPSPSDSMQIPAARGLILLALILGANASTAHQAKEPVPTVATASVPFYPPLARTARIEGIVHLRLSTDGAHVSAISVQSGPPMLVPAAEENVRTWEFKAHKPTTFEVTFRYKMLPESDCEVGNGTVLLRLPTEVEVSANGVQTCDPAVVTKPK